MRATKWMAAPPFAFYWNEYHWMICSCSTVHSAMEENLATINSSGSRNTMPFNYTGHPALALPVGKSSAGLPASMQLVGRFLDDPLLMRAAYAYQQSTDWDHIIGVYS